MSSAAAASSSSATSDPTTYFSPNTDTFDTANLIRRCKSAAAQVNVTPHRINAYHELPTYPGIELRELPKDDPRLTHGMFVPKSNERGFKKGELIFGEQPIALRPWNSEPCPIFEVNEVQRYIEREVSEASFALLESLLESGITLDVLVEKWHWSHPGSAVKHEMGEGKAKQKLEELATKFVVTQESLLEMLRLVMFYMQRTDGFVSGRPLSWCITRLASKLNHSCRPNAVLVWESRLAKESDKDKIVKSTKKQPQQNGLTYVEIALVFALRAIKPDEEITIAYAPIHMAEHDWFRRLVKPKKDSDEVVPELTAIRSLRLFLDTNMVCACNHCKREENRMVARIQDPKQPQINWETHITSERIRDDLVNMLRDRGLSEYGSAYAATSNMQQALFRVGILGLNLTWIGFMRWHDAYHLASMDEAFGWIEAILFLRSLLWSGGAEIALADHIGRKKNAEEAMVASITREYERNKMRVKVGSPEDRQLDADHQTFVKGIKQQGRWILSEMPRKIRVAVGIVLRMSRQQGKSDVVTLLSDAMLVCTLGSSETLRSKLAGTADEPTPIDYRRMCHPLVRQMVRTELGRITIQEIILMWYSELIEKTPLAAEIRKQLAEIQASAAAAASAANTAKQQVSTNSDAMDTSSTNAATSPSVGSHPTA
jgi:hypothetical protein